MKLQRFAVKTRRDLQRVALVLSAIAVATARAASLATWDGANGNWSDNTHWSTYPNAPLTTAYSASIGSGSVALDVSPTIQDLDLSGGTLAGPGTLSTAGLFTFSGGWITGNVIANGGLLFTGGSDLSISGGSLTNGTGSSATFALSANLVMVHTAGEQQAATFTNAGTFIAQTNHGISSVYLGGGIAVGGSVAVGGTETVNNSGVFNINLADTAGTFTIGSGASFGNTGTVNVQSGTFELDGGGTGTGTFNVSAGTTLRFAGGVFETGPIAGPGTLRTDATVTSGKIAVSNWSITGSHTIRLNVGAPSTVDALLLGGAPNSWTGKLDLTNNNLIVGSASNTTSFANVQNQIRQAAGAPAPANPWNGTGGITSSSAAAASGNATKTGLGYATGAEYSALTGLTLFDSLTFNPTDTLVKYTLVGDANLDGTVNINDFFALSGHINLPGDWSQGNFNYAGNVTIDDFFAMTGNFGKTLAAGNLAAGVAPEGGTMIAASAAPEPGSLVVGLVAGAVLVMRRRKARGGG